MIWDKGSSPFPDSTRYYQIFEYMFVISKGKPKSINIINDRPNKHANSIMRGTFRQKDGTLKKFQSGNVIKTYGARFNVWQMSPERNNKIGHPAVFPERLVRDHMISWSSEGDVVLDPFMGSGTTGIVAIKNKRGFIGIEISEEYFNLAKERIETQQQETERKLF